MIRKLVSEFLGTMFLVLFGCGIAVGFTAYMNTLTTVTLPYTLLVIALGFGLSLTAIIYMFGNTSGAHVNPAVSIAMAIDGRMSVLECVEYVVVQILGGIVGAEIVGLLFGNYASLGANGYATLSNLPEITTAGVAFAVEAILTFAFVLVVLTASKEKNKNAGLGIGLSLALVHLFGIPFTGTSVNPARSIGPALLTTGDDGLVLSQLWVFIVAPIVGAVLAALLFRFVLNVSTKEKISTKVEEVKETIADVVDEVEKETKKVVKKVKKQTEKKAK